MRRRIYENGSMWETLLLAPESWLTGPSVPLLRSLIESLSFDRCTWSILTVRGLSPEKAI
jgi:hypothetical protein